jgi:hypothetical protein
MEYPNATGQYHLFVDAALGDENNLGGLGAVLMQDQVGGLRKPVAYASRRLDKHERNYPVFLAEMQAAVFGMKQFHHFLITGRFALYTDHRPLCKLWSVHVKTLNRLQLKMTELHPDNPAVPRSTHKTPTVGKWVHCKIPATVIDDILYVRASLRKGHVIRKDLRIAVPSNYEEGNLERGTQQLDWGSLGKV